MWVSKGKQKQPTKGLLDEDDDGPVEKAIDLSAPYSHKTVTIQWCLCQQIFHTPTQLNLEGQSCYDHKSVVS